METRREVRTWVWVVAGLGAAAMIIGAFLPWLDTGGLNMGGGKLLLSTVVGVDISAGIISLVFGIVAAGLVLLALVLRRAARPFGILLLLGGVGAVAAATYVLIAAQDVYIGFVAGELDVESSSLNDLPKLFDSGLLSSAGKVGLFLTLGGGGLLLISGIAAIFTRTTSQGAEADARASFDVRPTAHTESDTETR
jgi:hypothetical protein